MFFLFLIPRAHAGSRHFFIIMAVSMAVAAFFYLTMSTGSPAALIEGRLFYWDRYIDWMIKTPLLLLDLALLALARWQRIINPGNQADLAGCVHYPNRPSGRVQPHRLRQGVQVHRQHGRDDRPPST